METHGRRYAKRVEVKVPVELEVLEVPPEPLAGLAPANQPEMAGLRFRGELRNLSSEGAFVGAEVLPPITSRVSLRFTLDQIGAVSVTGVLMWRRAAPTQVIGSVLPPEPTEPGFGLRFEELSSELQQALTRIVSR
jgi:hypothetical protein